MAVVLGVVLVIRSQRPSGVVRALEIARDPANFETAAQAGESFARIADLVFDEGKRCSRHVDECAEIVSASVYPQLAAYRALRCPPADIDRVRRSMVRTLDALDRRLRGADVRIPAVSPVRCAG